MRPRSCLQCASLAVVWCALQARSAAALDWIVIPYGVSSSVEATRAADKLAHGLAERRLGVASQHELRDLFLERSRAHLPADAKLASMLAEARTRALDHAAYGRREAARRAAEEAMQAAERTPEALEDTDLARHVLDACLAVVRVDLQEHDRARAVEDAQRCRRLVPDLAPRESTHAAEVVGVLAEADNQLRRAGAGTLTVLADTDQACGVFVNGRRLGATPFPYEHAPLGATSVFLECGTQRSRLHLVQLQDRPAMLTIGVGSDARISDRTVIALVYDSEQTLREQLASDVKRVGETVAARDVVLVRQLPERGFEAVRYSMSRGRPVATVRIEPGALAGSDQGDLQRAAETLALEREEAPVPLAFQARPANAAQIAGVQAPPASPQEPTSNRHEAAPARQRRVWTWSLGAATVAAGAAVLGLGLAVQNKLADHKACTENEEPNCDALSQKGDRLAVAVNVTAGIAGALAVGTLTAFFVEGRKRSLQASLGAGGVVVRGAF
jgi:hypothetical protein